MTVTTACVDWQSTKLVLVYLYINTRGRLCTFCILVSYRCTSGVPLLCLRGVNCC